MSTDMRPSGGAATGPERRLSGLTGRMVLASGLLLVLIAGAIGFLLVAIEDLQDSGRVARDAREELIALDGVEKLVVDLETGLRGFVLTRERRFLDPWNDARGALPARLAALERLVAESPAQLRRVGVIRRDTRSYVDDYGLPLISAAQRGDPSARTVEATEEGKRRVDSLRAVFVRFRATERALINERQDRADVAAERAVRAAVLALLLSVVLVMLFAGYLTRAIVQPVRRAAQMAGRLAGGDLAARTPATGVGEVGRLEEAFNEMAGSLERSRDELAELAAEQAALRRVATLVARAAPPPALFAAVAEEVGRLLSADVTALSRHDPDEMFMVVAAWSATGESVPIAERYPIDEGTITKLVRDTERPARMDEYADSGDGGTAAGRFGIRSAVAAPITVEGRLWGSIAVGSTGDEPPPAGTEERLAEFTDLVATAIANAEARGELAASRARVVAAADETRRLIERDLHDGAQQRLVSLALKLRAASAVVPDELTDVHEEVARVGSGLEEVLDELREISRGIHPAILSQGGLGPALRTLARRSAVPVDLEVDTKVRLPGRVEVAAYYVVSEALANVAKHADASGVQVRAHTDGGVLRLAIRDDGVGGADPDRGSGLIGLKDRVEASGGTITVESKPGEGTAVAVEIPIDGSEPTSS